MERPDDDQDTLLKLLKDNYGAHQRTEAKGIEPKSELKQRAPAERSIGFETDFGH
jgi:hypothetical protein